MALGAHYFLLLRKSFAW